MKQKVCGGMKKTSAWLKNIYDKFSSTVFFNKYLKYVLIFLLTFAQSYIIQLSLQHIAGFFLFMKPYNVLLEVSLLFSINVLVALCAGKWWYGYCGTVAFAFLYGVSNYYVIKFHGGPLTLRELRSAFTAMNVISSYNFTVEKYVYFQVAALICCVIGIVMLRAVEKEKIKWSRKTCIIRGAIFAVLAVFFVCAFTVFESTSVRRKGHWNWHPVYTNSGCLVCVVDEAVNNRLIIVPKDYSTASAEAIAEEYAEVSDTSGDSVQRPDVILILNETFYDLSASTDLKTDVDPFAVLNEREDLIKGQTFISSGYGTNGSEYEYLCSNSLYLIGATPFNYINMHNANTIVSHMNALGYHTLGAHPATAENYRRGAAYPAVGFDEYHFIEDFDDLKTSNGRKQPNDETTFNNLINWYENMGEEPRFAFLLTIQNHGGYKTADDSLDTVHVTGNSSYITDDAKSEINEFLSSVILSSQAFSDLIDYYKTVDRPVVICMTGDHAPAFIDHVISPSLSEEEKSIYRNVLPYYIWSNIELDETCLPELVSMHMLTPCLLKSAGCELTGYEKYITDLSKKYPVLTYDGIYIDSQGNSNIAADFDELPQELKDYLYLEYSNISNDSDDLKDFFAFAN